MKAFNRRNRPIIWILMIFSLNRLPFLDRNWFHIRFPTKISRKFTTFSPPKARLVAGGHCIKKEGSTAKFGKCGEDSFMVSQKEDSSSALFAVADGVGGWISHGGDSSGVSNGMLKAMKILHQKNNETASISHLIKDAFKKLIEYGKLSKGLNSELLILVHLKKNCRDHHNLCRIVRFGKRKF